MTDDRTSEPIRLLDIERELAGPEAEAALADEESPALWDGYVPGRLGMRIR